MEQRGFKQHHALHANAWRRHAFASKASLLFLAPVLWESQGTQSYAVEQMKALLHASRAAELRFNFIIPERPSLWRAVLL